MKIGAQLYTVRDFAKTPEDFALTLKRVADIGYKYVQVSGTCPFEAEWLRAELDKNGLKCPLTHTDPKRITDDTAAVMAEHRIFGCDNIGIGWFDLLARGSDDFIKTFLPAANKIAEGGLKLTYHNHDFEFARSESGKLYFEDILEAFSPDILNITLDTFWVQAGGADPIKWLRDLQGRTRCIHFKDMAYGRKMAVIGEGNMNFDGIFAAALDTGVEYAFVEQDDCNGEDPFDCLARSYAYIKAAGLCN